MFFFLLLFIYCTPLYRKHSHGLNDKLPDSSATLIAHCKTVHDSVHKTLIPYSVSD